MLPLQLRDAQSAGDDDFQLVDLNWLREKIVGALPDRLASVTLFVLAGDDNDLERGIRFKQVRQCRKALAGVSRRRRQTEVERHNRGSMLLELFKRTQPVLGHDNVILRSESPLHLGPQLII